MANALLEEEKVEDKGAEIPAKPEEPKRTGKSKMRIILPIVIVVLAVGGYFLWKNLSSYESTDDAQVDGHINAISSRISGHVTGVLVEDQQVVQKGDLLIQIDPRDYEIAVAKAEADLADAEATLLSTRSDIPITSTNTASQLTTARSGRVDAGAILLSAQRQQNATHARLESAEAQVREADANYKKTLDDVERYRQLVAKEEISRQQFDTAVAASEAAKATVDARKAAVNEARQNITVAEAAVDQARARIVQSEATIQAALTGPQQIAGIQAKAKSAAAKVEMQQALLDQAKLNLSYTKIVAPVSGIVGKKSAEIGQNVSPGQQLLAIVPPDDIWITANFKETQLRHMKKGQKVTLSVDAYGGDYTGTVTGIGGASGARYSLLPPENATGNYVKVVQRIPVRIDLDPGQNRDHRLRPGMSVTPKVYIH